MRVPQRLTAGLLAAAFLCSAIPQGTVHAATDTQLSAESTLSLAYPEAAAAIRSCWNFYGTSVSLSAWSMSTTDVQALVSELLFTYGDFFYVSTEFTSHSINGIVQSVDFVYLHNERTIKSMRVEYQQKIDTVVSGVSTAWSDKETALYLHDYLVTHTEYDTALAGFDAYDALISGKAVCQGYTLAYHDLLAAAGISSYAVSSDSLGHIWNLLVLDDGSYYVDVTWDDPIPDRLRQCLHNNFLVSAAILSENSHNTNDWLIYGHHRSNVQTADAPAGVFWRNAVGQTCWTGTAWLSLQRTDVPTKAILTLNHDTETKQTPLLTLNEQWMVWDSDSSYWNDCFSGVSCVNGWVYFNTPTEICACRTDGSSLQTVYTRSAAEAKQGYIYGFRQEDSGALTYAVSTSPSAAGSRNTFSPRPALSVALRGDANGDGLVNTQDAVWILRAYSRMMLTGEATATSSADANLDGVLSSADAVLVLRYAAAVMLHGTADWADFAR